MPAAGSSPADMKLKCFEDLYGYRGPSRSVYYLSPWEFMMWWECLPLPQPKMNKVSGSDSKDAVDNRCALRPESCNVETVNDSSDDEIPLTVPIPAAVRHSGRNFDVNPAAESEQVVFFPELESEPQLRWAWYLRRRHRPMVPAPTSTPMPDKAGDREGKARLFSLYMRPWVLDRRHASLEVPHITDLDVTLVPKRRVTIKQAPTAAWRRSYADSWSWYVCVAMLSLSMQHA